MTMFEKPFQITNVYSFTFVPLLVMVAEKSDMYGNISNTVQINFVRFVDLKVFTEMADKNIKHVYAICFCQVCYPWLTLLVGCLVMSLNTAPFSEYTAV